MKKLYWESAELDWRVDLLIAIVAVIGLIGVQHFKVFSPAPHYEEKLAAAQLMEKSMDVIDRYRAALPWPFPRFPRSRIELSTPQRIPIRSANP
uniref:Uncharacterized protein n=1 Tax=Candidatus Kentrum sp. TC TaxID=2126339 RepID=A0A451AF08_9GAMM|nr:MAG: hypothetical protein BECKTC1821F_GA0114240_11345 [Candidatus Kentron sp. TC]